MFNQLPVWFLLKKNWQQQWIEAIAPDEPHKLSRRLLWDGFSPDDFIDHLQTSGQSLGSTELNWKSCLLGCRRAVQEAWDQSLLAVGSDQEQLAFVDLWWPIRCHAKELLQKGLKFFI